MNQAIDIDNIEIIENRKNYLKSKSIPKMEWTSDNVYNALISTFEKQTNKVFMNNRDNINKVKTLAYYLARDKRFFRSPLLNKDLNSPSFSKGLLIFGDYGVGKTTILKTIPAITNNYFSYDLSVDLVSEYESLISADRSTFMEKHKFGRRIYDDLRDENDASNYGLVNLFQNILESRYGVSSLTIVACNYDKKHPLDLDLALDSLGHRYGGKVLDRIYGMFNIIEFCGKSMRGR
ncbi:MAG: hypothetical protein GYB35_17045 [Algicola sp.]|nr:hypothetical protein [Algicola sp.]